MVAFSLVDEALSGIYSGAKIKPSSSCVLVPQPIMNAFLALSQILDSSESEE
jgi:hypothetical protein